MSGQKEYVQRWVCECCGSRRKQVPIKGKWDCPDCGENTVSELFVRFEKGTLYVWGERLHAAGMDLR